jgi:hypothetical protein
LICGTVFGGEKLCQYILERRESRQLVLAAQRVKIRGTHHLFYFYRGSMVLLPPPPPPTRPQGNLCKKIEGKWIENQISAVLEENWEKIISQFGVENRMLEI